MAKVTFAVVLSGCGVYDGSEIHEAVLSLLAIDRAGAGYRCFAPDIDQMHVVNHLTGQPGDETRNVLVEASRIARGAIAPLDELDVAQVDALLFPGGFGAAKNLCDFAVKGPDCVVDAGVARVIRAAHAAGKPIGALCIAPALVARVLGDVTVTIGDDSGTAQAIAAMGATHQAAGHAQVVVDRAHKVVTTPCYMLDASISQIADGAAGVVAGVLSLLED